jgi:Ca-activated chloride channel homolog
MKALILILAFIQVAPGDGDDKGRRGNAMYRNGEYTEAANLYRDALVDVQREGPGRVHTGLLNNLGASLFRQGDYEKAASAFSGAVRMASSSDDGVRAMYNAGNAAAMQEELESALDYYTRALLSDPSNQNAKFNYEYVKRQLEEQQDQDQQQEDQDENQDQQDQEQNQDQQDQEQNQDQQQQQQQQNQDQQQQEQQEQQPQNPEELTKEEAERLLQALENEEEQLLREIQKMDVRPRRVEKDW